MLKITIDEKSLQTQGLTLGDVLYSLIASNKIDLQQVENSLLERQLLINDGGIVKFTFGFIEKVEKVLLDSDKEAEPEARLRNLVKKLQAVFPKGKKEGTIYYWGGNSSEITHKLKLFFKKFGHDFTDDQIIAAATEYVKSFNDVYNYMQLLKYFILKNKATPDGNVEVSELLSYIENAGQKDTSSTHDWKSTLH